MNKLFQPPLLLIAVATQNELARQVRYLKVENEILRSNLPARITVTEKEKNRLAKFAAKLGAGTRLHRGKVTRSLRMAAKSFAVTSNSIRLGAPPGHSTTST